jgi:hypothetical protein
LEVDGTGEFVKGDDGRLGNWQGSGTYRIVTREGMWVYLFLAEGGAWESEAWAVLMGYRLGLSDYLMGKVVERLREEEKKETKV